MAHKLQCQDSEMDNVATMFGRFADTTQEHINKIESCMSKLRGDGWIGLGASRFFDEMDSEVLPQLKILQSGFEEAERQTKQIVNMFEEYTSLIQGLFQALM